MKRATFWIILLILVAGAAFYFGLVTIEPDSFGLAYSSITGLIGKPLEPGNFYWFWQKLVPNTFFLYTIEKTPVFVEIDASLAMPGSENLKEFGSFELAIHVEVGYRLGFDSAKYLLDQGILSSFHPLFQREIKSLVDGSISAFTLKSLPSSPSEAQSIDYGVFETLRESLNRTITGYTRRYMLSDATVKVVLTKVPEMSIYAEALSKYSRYIEFLYSQKEVEFTQELELEKRRRFEELEFERLKKYGDLLSRYPSLLKFLYIEKFGEKAEVVVIPSDAATGYPKMLEILPEALKKAAPQEQLGGSKQGAGEESGGSSAKTKAENAQGGKPGADSEAGGIREKKWYEGLMFWRHPDR